MGYPLDTSRFYFGQHPADRDAAKLIELELGGAARTIRLNRAPVARYHSMIVPNRPENQFFRASDAQTIVDFFAQEIDDPDTTLGYNSLFSAASQNSKHLQIFYEKDTAFGRGTRWLRRQGDVRVGLLGRAPNWFVRLADAFGLGRFLKDHPGGVIRLQG